MSLKVGQSPKLGNENYKEWAVSLSLYLEGSGYWDIVEGTREKPKQKTNDENWAADNAMAAALIFNSCEKTQQQQHILNSRNAKDSWDTLKAIHSTPNKQRLGTLLRQFYKFEAGTRSIDDSVAYLNGLQADIRAINEKETPSDFSKAIILLDGLSNDFQLIGTLLASEFDDEKVKFNTIVARLREEETKRGNTSSKENALLAQKKDTLKSAVEIHPSLPLRRQNAAYAWAHSLTLAR